MDLLSILEQAVTYCENRGAEAEVFGVIREEIIVTLERNDIKLCIKQYTKGVGVRTVTGASVGFACCNSLNKDTVKKTAQKAVDMSKKTPPLSFNPLASPGQLPETSRLYDPEAETFGEEQAILTTEAMMSAAREDPRVSIDSGEFNVVLREKAICTSTGICASERKSMFSWFLVGMARENGHVGSLEHEYGCCTETKAIHAEETARALGRKAAANLHPEKVEPFSGDLILGPDAVSALIGEPLAFSLNANHVHRSQSVLQHKLQEKIASSMVTVRDDATAPAEFNASAFDREGTPHKSLVMIKDGVLHTFMYDALAARRESAISTGNAAGTFREIPTIGVTNLIIEGDSDLKTMIEETKTGLIITRFSGSCSQISGDFSGAVKGAHFIRSGNLQHPVKEAVISGNLYDMLFDIADISRETLRQYRMILPYIKVRGMQIIS